MFAAEVYSSRREMLAATGLSGIVLIPGHDEAPRNYLDNCYPFRQDSSFLYYFGHEAPGLWGMIDCDSGKSMLCGEDATMDDIIWTGPVPTVAERAEAVGASSATLQDLASVVAQVKSHGRDIHFLPQYRAQTRAKLARLLERCASEISEEASAPLIQAIVAQRSVKEEREVAEMEAAVAISREMYAAAMETARPGRTEQAVAGAMTAVVAAYGSAPAFPIICTRRGEVLHNHDRTGVLAPGDMILIDSGAESTLRYASDITRTLPVGGVFSGRKRHLYSLLLEAQKAAIAACAPGVSFRDVHLETVTRIAQGLSDIGLMQGDVDEAVAAGAHALFMPHGLGHMIGLDVHDMESFGEDYVGYDDETVRSDQFGLKALRFGRELQPGFCLTVEPGIYFIPELIRRWAEAGTHSDFINYEEVVNFIGVGGMRIEDDVLITQDASRVLGPAIPKELAELEALMG